MVVDGSWAMIDLWGGGYTMTIEWMVGSGIGYTTATCMHVQPYNGIMVGGQWLMAIDRFLPNHESIRGSIMVDHGS